MRISNYSKYDIIYLKLGDSTHQVANQNLIDEIAIDVDEKERIAEIEFLSAPKYFNLTAVLPVTVEQS